MKKIYEVSMFDNGTVHWRYDGMLHREDGPALIEPGGKEYYYLNGVMMPREDYLRRVAMLKAPPHAIVLSNWMETPEFYDLVRGCLNYDGRSVGLRNLKFRIIEIVSEK
jgi:hypothetical protein